MRYPASQRLRRLWLVPLEHRQSHGFLIQPSPHAYPLAGLPSAMASACGEKRATSEFRDGIRWFNPADGLKRFLRRKKALTG